MGIRGGDVHLEIDKYMERNQTRAEEWIDKMMYDNDSTLSQFRSTWSICRVPEKLRSVKNEAYDPQLVSIGPIHYEDPRLRSMEHHKRHYLISLLQRTKPRDVAIYLQKCCYTILKLDEKVRACYADSIEPDKMKLAFILLQDAGFMLELFLRCYNTGSRVPNDPVFTTWRKLVLQRDLALLENQIPFFVLQSLYEFVFPSGAFGVSSLNDLALRFCKSTLNNAATSNGKHLLHLLYNCYVPSSPETGERNTGSLEFIHNATALKYAGVSFKIRVSDNLLNMNFDNGVFYIPTLRVHGATDSLFRNFIAFEHCQGDTPHYITSYCMLLDRLIDTAKDVEVLVDKQIIENHLGDGSEVSGVFNDICKEVVLKDFYFAKLCDQVNEYSEDPWHSYKAELRLNYFKNPWSITSFIAAIILLALTSLQTLYSVLSYYQSPSPDNHTTIIMVVFVSLAAILFLPILAFGLCYLIKKKKTKKSKVISAPKYLQLSPAIR